MSLSLKITSYQRLTPSQQTTYHAESDSFTIGRNSENDWAIPDPQRFLSGVHCRIQKEGDTYSITDISTNGVFLNGSEQRIERNDTVMLNAGDKFRIGDYEFEVLIEEDSPAGGRFTADDETMVGVDPFDDPFPVGGEPLAAEEPGFDDDPFADTPPAETQDDQDDDFLKDLNTPLSHMDESPLGSSMSIDSLMGFDDGDADDEQDSAEDLKQRHTPLNEAFKPSTPVSPSPPPKVAQPNAPDESTASTGMDDFPDNWDEATGLFSIPDDNEPFESSSDSDFPDNWDETTGMLKVPVDTPPPKPEEPEVAHPAPPKPKKPVQVSEAPKAEKPPAPAATIQSGDAMAAFARGAGLNPEDISGIDQNVLFEQVGRMVIEFTEGLIQTLGGRTHIKSEFRLDQTMIRPAENNPFKFSTSKTRTLLQLLSKSDPAYMTGVNAINEGFDDVNAHQMAVIAGMEAALQDILQRFNPKTLETRIVSDSILDNIIPGGKKAKYWDIFKLLFDEIAGEAEDNFQQLFGKEFTRAYEEQLNRLKNTRKE
jgi:type VI secretion system protein